jgi:hypothetical protein
MRWIADKSAVAFGYAMMVIISLIVAYYLFRLATYYLV